MCVCVGGGGGGGGLIKYNIYEAASTTNVFLQDAKNVISNICH